MSKILDYKNSIWLKTGFSQSMLSLSVTIIVFCVLSFLHCLFLPSVLIHFHKQIKAESQMRYVTLLSIIHFPLPLSESISAHSRKGAKQLINLPVHCFQNMGSLLGAVCKSQSKVQLLSTVKDSGIQTQSMGRETYQ